MARLDEVGTKPDYVTGIGPQQLPLKVSGTGTTTITRTRPDNRQG